MTGNWNSRGILGCIHRTKGATIMNPYGAKARNHWQKWLPKRYSQLEDPESYFSNLGEEIEARVEELSQAIAGSDPPDETYHEKLRRLNMAHFDAEAQALREMALIEPESQAADQ